MPNETQMPREIFAFLYIVSDFNGKFQTSPGDVHDTSYTRTDIANQWKEALESIARTGKQVEVLATHPSDRNVMEAFRQAITQAERVLKL